MTFRTSRDETRQKVDWEQVRARLAQALHAVEEIAEPSADEVRRVMESRTLALARSPAEADTPAGGQTLLVFVLGGRRYGIDIAQALEALPLTDVRPLPSTPPSVLGVVNLRGRVLPVIDFRALFQPLEPDVPGGSLVVVVDAGGMTFGILAHALEGIVQAEPDEIARVPTPAFGERQALVRGITSTLVGVLDLDALVGHPQFVVNQEVERG